MHWLTLGTISTTGPSPSLAITPNRRENARIRRGKHPGMSSLSVLSFLFCNYSFPLSLSLLGPLSFPVLLSMHIFIHTHTLLPTLPPAHPFVHMSTHLSISLTILCSLSALTGRFPNYPDESLGGSTQIFSDKTPEQVPWRWGRFSVADGV